MSYYRGSSRSSRLPSLLGIEYARRTLENTGPQELRTLVRTSWIAAISAIAGQPPLHLSAAEAAILLSPFWRLGKSMGLTDGNLYDFAVRHVRAELPRIQMRPQRIRVPPGFDYRQSPRAFNPY
jgi:hypothetical protein